MATGVLITNGIQMVQEESETRRISSDNDGKTNKNKNVKKLLVIHSEYF